MRAALAAACVALAGAPPVAQAAASFVAPAAQAQGPVIGPDAVTPASPGLPGSGAAAPSPATQRLRALAEGSGAALAEPDGRPGPPAPVRRGGGTLQPASPAQRDAAWTLGLLALHGIGMPADAAQARHWFDRARQAGHPLAAAGLAWCDIDGCGGPPDPAAARPWIAQLRTADPALALYLEWFVATRLAPLPTARPQGPPGAAPTEEAAPPHQALLARAARAGSAGAQNELALENVARGRTRAALELLRSGAPRSPAAAANLQRLSSRPADDAAPAASARTVPAPPRASARAVAAQPGDSEVDTPEPQTVAELFQQAQRFHRGMGVPSNYAEAIRLYQQAAARGSAPARRMLELIYSRPAAGGGVDIGWMQQLARFDVSQPGELLPVLPAPGPQPLLRDPSPLYELLPSPWRPTGPP
ncbi:hypothetical protein ASF94_04520 [Acidovorax sp. Leaf160]|nr:hypothetical protein ASF94_04520 [Acidovorax sp. Leaf160]